MSATLRQGNLGGKESLFPRGRILGDVVKVHAIDRSI